MKPLALFAAVAPTLPRIHSAPIARLSGGPARFREAPIAVEQQGPREFGEAVIQEGKDEQLIPEDVASIGLAVPSARRHADIEVDSVQRGGLQQVKDVQPEYERRAVAVRDVDVAALPEVLQRENVALQQII